MSELVESQNISPRLLSREAAAAYCSMSPKTFDAWRRAGRIPGPIPGTSRWDRMAIDDALDLASGRISNNGTSSELDEWLAKRENKTQGNKQG